MRMGPFRAYLRLRELYSLPSIDSFGLLLSWLPTLTRYLNFNVLDDRLSPFTILSVAGQGYLFVGTLGHFVMSLDDKVHLANGFCAIFVSSYTGVSIAVHVLKRKTMRRLYHELVQYNKEFIQKNADQERGEAVSSLSKQLPMLMISTLSAVWINWFLYTTSPLIFEWVRGKPLGSTKRISTPVWPYLCDIRTTPCFELYYGIVATIWFFGVTAFVASSGLTQSFYMYISFMYRALGVSIKNIRTDAERAARNSKEFEGELRPSHNVLVHAHMHRLLNVYIRQHQFLIRWSKEYIDVGIEVAVFMLLAGPCAVGIAGLKLIIDTNYVLDEVPLIMATLLAFLFTVCWFSQMLHDSSLWMHWAIYTSDWLQADNALRVNINMMMMRSFKPLVTKHGMVGTVLLHSFVVAVKHSYSFLQAVHSMT